MRGLLFMAAQATYGRRKALNLTGSLWIKSGGRALQAPHNLLGIRGGGGVRPQVSR